MVLANGIGALHMIQKQVQLLDLYLVLSYSSPSHYFWDTLHRPLSIFSIALFTISTQSTSLRRLRLWRAGIFLVTQHNVYPLIRCMLQRKLAPRIRGSAQPSRRVRYVTAATDQLAITQQSLQFVGVGSRKPRSPHFVSCSIAEIFVPHKKPPNGPNPKSSTREGLWTPHRQQRTPRREKKVPGSPTRVTIACAGARARALHVHSISRPQTCLQTAFFVNRSGGEGAGREQTGGKKGRKGGAAASRIKDNRRPHS